MIDAVLFDWGGTLNPVHSVDVAELWASAARVLAPQRTAEIAEALHQAERELWGRTEGSARSFTTAELLQTVSSKAGVDLGVAEHEMAMQAYREGWAPYLAARPEAAGVVQALRDRGLRTGLLSNTHWPREWQEAALAADGLADLLDARVYTSDLPYMKPHPAAFTALLQAVGVEPARGVFVGDRLHDDISGAKGVGMRAIWIRNDTVPGYDVEPDATIEGLNELPTVIDGWRR